MSDCHALAKCTTRCRAVSFWTAAVVVLLFSALYTILVKMALKRAFIATEYVNSINQIGFWIHATTGTAYFVFGFMQFSEPFRRSYPAAHRATGYAYYVSAAISSVGIALLCIGGAKAAESMVAATLIVWPLWMYWMYESFVAVRMGDIQRHRDLNLRAFILALAIVTMRPVTVAIIHICGITQNEALKTAVWICWLGTTVCTEIFLWRESHAEPRALVLPSGKVVAHSTYPSMLHPQWLSASIVSMQHVSPRTLMLTLRLAHADRISVPLIAGQHICMRVTAPTGDVLIRSYSPISDAAQLEAGLVTLVARHVPNGAMSCALSQMAIVWQSDATSVAQQIDVAFAQPALTYTPNTHRCIVLLAAGTGITPFFNVIRAILDNPRDTAHVVLMWINSSAEDMFCAEQIATWAHSPRFHALTHVTSKAIGNRFDVHRLRALMDSARTLTSVDTDATRVLLCGPHDFVQSMTVACCHELHMDADSVFAFGVSDR